MSGVVSEPYEPLDRPSDEYLATLRRMGASEETIRRASGEPKPRTIRRWWRR